MKLNESFRSEIGTTEIMAAGKALKASLDLRQVKKRGSLTALKFKQTRPKYLRPKYPIAEIVS